MPRFLGPLAFVVAALVFLLTPLVGVSFAPPSAEGFVGSANEVAPATEQQSASRPSA